MDGTAGAVQSGIHPGTYLADGTAGTVSWVECRNINIIVMCISGEVG